MSGDSHRIPDVRPPATRTLKSGAVRVTDYRCQAGPADRPYVETFGAFSLAYVRTGSFGFKSHGRSFELIPGALLIGLPGDEYVCTHDHHAGGDECISFQYAPELAEQVVRKKSWCSRSLPPIAEIMVVGECVQACADARNDFALDELGLLLAAKLEAVLSGKPRERAPPSLRDRRRAIDLALWLDHHAAEDIDLAAGAAMVGLSSFHLLRVFAKVVGVTPHQYLLRSRLRRAARLLVSEDRAITDIAFEVGFNDVSNFVRSFHRAAGLSPGAFRRAAREDRKILQEAFARHS